MGLAWQKLPGRSTGLGTHRTAYDARGGMGGALGVLGVGYAGRSQRRMRRVNRSAARLSRGGIGDLRVECVKEVSGRVSSSIWGAGAPWERPPTDYLNPPPAAFYLGTSEMQRSPPGCSVSNHAHRTSRPTHYLGIMRKIP